MVMVSSMLRGGRADDLAFGNAGRSSGGGERAAFPQRHTAASPVGEEKGRTLVQILIGRASGVGTGGAPVPRAAWLAQVASQAHDGAGRGEGSLVDGAAESALTLCNTGAKIAPSVRGEGTCTGEASIAGSPSKRVERSVGSSQPRATREIHKKMHAIARARMGGDSWTAAIHAPDATSGHGSGAQRLGRLRSMHMPFATGTTHASGRPRSPVDNKASGVGGDLRSALAK